MNYLEDLRKLVGHRPLQLVGATVFLIDDQGRLLLLERLDNRCWGPAGGMVEPGEIVEEAGIREILEETGLQPRALSLYGVFSGDEQHYVYPNGDEVDFVNIVYLCREFTGEVHLSPEHTAWQWFEWEALPEPISPPIIPILARLCRDLKELEI
jgi:8-oxo-dGTP pyrophosphatase MutT (NUDIX family)